MSGLSNSASGENTQAFASSGLELARPDLAGGHGGFGDLTIPRPSQVPV